MKRSMSALAMLVLAGVLGALLPATPALAQQCPPGTLYVPEGYGKKAKWLPARCVPLARQPAPAALPSSGAATTRQLNQGELARIQAR